MAGVLRRFQDGGPAYDDFGRPLTAPGPSAAPPAVAPGPAPTTAGPSFWNILGGLYGNPVTFDPNATVPPSIAPPITVPPPQSGALRTEIGDTPQRQAAIPGYFPPQRIGPPQPETGGGDSVERRPGGGGGGGGPLRSTAGYATGDQEKEDWIKQKYLEQQQRRDAQFQAAMGTLAAGQTASVPMMAMAGGMLEPTRSGSFAESLGAGFRAATPAILQQRALEDQLATRILQAQDQAGYRDLYTMGMFLGRTGAAETRAAGTVAAAETRAQTALRVQQLKNAAPPANARMFEWAVNAPDGPHMDPAQAMVYLQPPTPGSRDSPGVFASRVDAARRWLDAHPDDVPQGMSLDEAARKRVEDDYKEYAASKGAGWGAPAQGAPPGQAGKGTAAGDLGPQVSDSEAKQRLLDYYNQHKGDPGFDPRRDRQFQIFEHRYPKLGDPLKIIEAGG
jgi:hypothetical protein